MLEKKNGRKHCILMTDTQFYLAVGLPIFAILMSFLGTTLQVGTINARITGSENSMSARISSLENSMNVRISSLGNSMNARLAGIDNRISNLENTMNSRFSSLEARFDTLTGKVIEIDNRR